MGLQDWANVAQIFSALGVFLAFGALIFAVQQIRVTNEQLKSAKELAELNAYHQIISTSLEYDKQIVSNPDLRPYFREKQVIAETHLSYKAAESIAEMLLDIMDHNYLLLNKIAMSQDQRQAYLKTFEASFELGPIVRKTYAKNRLEYFPEFRKVADVWYEKYK